MENDNQTQLTLDEKKELVKARREFQGNVIGIAGYLGKSTLIAMLETVLGAHGKVLKTGGRSGNWLNNKKTLGKLTNKYQYAIFEFDYQRGKNFAGLLRLIKPGIGVITNIGDAHLSYLKNAMRLALKKSEVVKYVARNGVAILNQDDDMSSALASYVSTARIVKFGFNHNANFFASQIKQNGPNGIELLLNNEREISLPIYSVSNVYNFLACLAVCDNLGIGTDEVVIRLQEDFILPEGRGNLDRINDINLIDESYSGTSRSVSKAARTLVGFGPHSTKTVFIVGDMADLGVNVEDRHLNMGYFLSALSIDYIITLGHYSKFIAQGLNLIPSSSKEIISVDNVEELLNTLKKILQPGMTLSVKGVGKIVFHRIKSLIEKL